MEEEKFGYWKKKGKYRTIRQPGILNSVHAIYVQTGFSDASREQTRIGGEKEKRMWKVRGTRRVHVFGSRSYRSGFRVDASAKKSSFWLSKCATRSGRKGTKRRGKNRVVFFLRLVGINKSSCTFLTRPRLRRMRVDVLTNETSETSERAMHTPVEMCVRIRPFGGIEFTRKLIYPNTRPQQPNFSVSFVSRTFPRDASTYPYFPSYFFQQQKCFLPAGIPTRSLRTSLTIPPPFPDIWL